LTGHTNGESHELRESLVEWWLTRSAWPEQTSMRRRIYVETSIPSFYFEIRAEPDMIARRDWTNQWWTRARDRDELVTSEAVLNELSRGGHPRQEDCLALVNGLRLLPIDGAITETIEGYFRIA